MQLSSDFVFFLLEEFSVFGILVFPTDPVLVLFFAVPGIASWCPKRTFPIVNTRFVVL